MVRTVLYCTVPRWLIFTLVYFTQGGYISLTSLYCILCTIMYCTKVSMLQYCTSLYCIFLYSTASRWFIFLVVHHGVWRGGAWDTTCSSPSCCRSHTTSPGPLCACSGYAEMENNFKKAFRIRSTYTGGFPLSTSSFEFLSSFFFYFFEISSLFTSIHFHPLLLVDPLPL